MFRIKTDESKPLFAPEVTANIRVILFIAASLVLMTVDHRAGRLAEVRAMLSTAVYPVQYLIQLPFHGWDRLSHRLTDHALLVDENQRLRQKQLFLNAQLQKMAALEAENRRLRLLLDSSVNISERVLIAELLKVDFDPYRHQILLNRGTRHGAESGQPLVDQEGVVGQIVHAGTLSSTAILITDPNHALPVQVNRNGLRTLAIGTGRFQELELPHIPNNEDIQIGDLLITSGLGGRFPRGYPVARVTRVEFDPGRHFARVTAEPTAQLDRIREVLMIISDPLPEAEGVAVGPNRDP